jgi:hypothetical protein
LYSPNEREKKNVNKRDAFLAGSTSTCRGHIRQHYDIYLARCKKEDLQPYPYAMPRDLWKKLQEEEKAKGSGEQKIDGLFPRAPLVNEFSRDEALHAVAQLIVCDDQVSYTTVPL